MDSSPHPSIPKPHSTVDASHGPAFAWLAAGFLLAGLGTVLLGPILPTVSAQWHLTDAQGGQLLLAKFIGSFIGGVSVPRRLRSGILAGTLLSALGFTLFALCHSLAPAAAALFISGIGLGQIIASTNILAGERYRAHTGSTLALLNFFWSLGAVITGLLAGALIPHTGLRNPLLAFAVLWVLVGTGGIFGTRSTTASPSLAAEETATLSLRCLLYFSLLLLLYGGLETCLTAWITTYTLRFSDVHLLAGQSGVVLLWASLTGGRIIASAVLRFLPETTVQRISLLLTFVFILLLTLSHTGLLLSLACILIGVSLSPFFPSTFALLMDLRPTARTAGFVIAVSGLGAALFPWLMGVLSSRAGSLRIAMTIPLTLAAVLLLLSFLRPRESTVRPVFSTAPLPTGGENPEKAAV
jgi:MFS transporter, FHS family, glucose/mannose:H+ symporter